MDDGPACQSNGHNDCAHEDRDHAFGSASATPETPSIDASSRNRVTVNEVIMPNVLHILPPRSSAEMHCASDEGVQDCAPIQRESHVGDVHMPDWFKSLAFRLGMRESAL
jgi:hypothetical protein